MDTSALTLPLNRSRQRMGDPYLKFQLAPGMQAVIAMPQVQEVLTLPMHRLTPIPHLPACVLGLMSRRSRVLWVIDLAQMLGGPVGELPYRPYELVILRVNGTSLAVRVQTVGSLCWLTSAQIQPPVNQFAPGIEAYLRGYVLHEQETWWVLDAAAIVQSPLLHAS